ncbi:MAG TPA: hypothetical protein VFG91_10410 [Woeseiaceae bacterium]|nr:hypothetical protein [Woeseiaceae bacterium]
MNTPLEACTRFAARAALALVLAAGPALAESTESTVEPWPESRSAASFEALLEKVFAGDPGGDGWGVLDMQPTVSFPALSEAEIARLFTGNTIYQNAESALYFAAGGALEGSINGDDLSGGRWHIEHGFVCMDAHGTEYELGCNYAALVLDRVVFFRPNGKARFTGLIKQGRL